MAYWQLFKASEKQPTKHFKTRGQTVVFQVVKFEHGPTYDYNLFTVAIVTVTDNNQFQ